jgi:hypothetical protein
VAAPAGAGVHTPQWGLLIPNANFGAGWSKGEGVNFGVAGTPGRLASGVVVVWVVAPGHMQGGGGWGQAVGLFSRIRKKRRIPRLCVVIFRIRP